MYFEETPNMKSVHLSWIFIIAFVANLALAQVDPGLSVGA